MRNSLAHIEQSVENDFSCTEPLKVLSSKILANNIEHLIQMLFIIISHSISNSYSVYLMLNDLLICKDGLFHDNVIRRFIISELQ